MLSVKNKHSRNSNWPVLLVASKASSIEVIVNKVNIVSVQKTTVMKSKKYVSTFRFNTLSCDKN